ncbi:MAG: fumarylacetoacetate hydrolase family protein [Candidatus Competibacteraceae bacterium]|jgi:2-keto-4-pentenoate hydratase/2-oxohepta-3-ene-1,7-dioic acid hydratase in catechol pathway|nr:fumarylacetoacetate hydrolase family protein [Candidatus Competibacteraceae bacterium]
MYRHRDLDNQDIALPVGKVVCVGRNYLDHIQELRNAVPETPVLFMKPATALVSLDAPLQLPTGQGRCHHELELAVLIGERLQWADAHTAPSAIVGYALALDLTLRDLQDELKSKGLPWERAKAFDSACPISGFISPEQVPDPQNIELTLQVNGSIRQQGNTGQMMLGIFELLAHISESFTLLPGDVVLTGTPAGVGELNAGDRLEMSLGDNKFQAHIAETSA